MNNIIRRLKKRMGFDKESEPILGEGQEEVTAPIPNQKKAKKVVEKVQETEIEKLEKELEELKEAEVPQEETVEEPRLPTQEEVNLNHEQRILQMEAKWFRLGGI